MHKKRKSFLFSLIFFIVAFLLCGSEKEIKILDFDGGVVKYYGNPVMDSKSDVDLPYILLETDLGEITLDSFSFENAYIWKSRTVSNYISAQPLFKKILETENVKFTGDKSVYADMGVSNGIIRVFPFDYKNSLLFAYKNIKIFYTADNATPRKTDPLYNYLIICSSKYDTVFERLKNWKMKRGFKTKIYNTEYIFANSSGRDDAEKLRNFIKTEYESSGIEYLLLCGDRGTVPVRKLYFMECGAGYYPDEDSIPADIYYTNLEGDFDFDKDGTYGEMEDSCDLTPELCGGRILFDTIYYGPSPIVDRIISYEQTKETEHLQRGIFSGMVLWNPPYTPGGEAKNIIINDIVPSWFHIKKFYESEGHSGKSDILDSIDMGYGIFNHNGHGSFKGIWVDTMTSISRGDATGLTNGMKTGMFYSIGCWVGAFDRDNTTYSLHSIAENLQDSPTGGFVSIYANSRYGWGAPGYPGWGVSDVLDYKFFKLLFSLDNKEAGSLLNKLKLMIAPLSDEPNLYRWHLYEINYFGDPSTYLYTRNPDSIFASLSVVGDEIAVRVYDKHKSGVKNLSVSVLQDTLVKKTITDENGFAYLHPDTSYSGYTYLTVYGGNCMTLTDSFYIDSANAVEIDVKFDKPAFWCRNLISVINKGAVTREVRFAGRYVDTTFTTVPGVLNEISYYSGFSPLIVDTLMVYKDGFLEDTIFLTWENPKISFDSINVTGNQLNVYLAKEPSRVMQDCSVNFILTGNDTLQDTTVYCDLNGGFVFSNTLPYICDDVIKISASLYKNDTLASFAEGFLTNGKYLFCDSFDDGYANWDNVDEGWGITYDNYLHPGVFNGYENNMNIDMLSREFSVVPQSVCSVDLNIQLPILEFIEGAPIFDLDGIFIKLLTQEDTVVLDFISSGGALAKGGNSLIFKGVKEYLIETDTIIKARLLLNFVSDSVITDKGVYIKSIRISSKNSYESFESAVIRMDYPIFSSDSMLYQTKGLKTPLKFSMISVDGRIIKNCKISENGIFSVNMANLPTGIYFIVFESGGRIYRDKLIYFK